MMNMVTQKKKRNQKKKIAKHEDDDDDEVEKPNVDEHKNENVNINSGALPCTINTFGFGPNHKASLLQAIAEHGRGMYAFIEKSEMITDIFAECLGGLISVFAQNIQVTIESLNKVKINKCLSERLNIETKTENEKYTISINDIQSEEKRDFVFELTIPSLNEKKKNIQSCKFLHSIKML